MPLKLDCILRARDRIKPHVRRTPLERSGALSVRTGCELFLKLENWQVTGSFKARGAINRLLTLSARERAKGIITASAGNHALGVALAAQICGAGGKIVLPLHASAAKKTALGCYGLTLMEQGNDYDEAEEIAWEIAERENLTFVHAFEDPEIMAGQGTIALEISEQLPDAGAVLVPIGGGGLISGIAVAAKALNPAIKVIGVQSEASPAMAAALEAGKVVETPLQTSLADGLTGRRVGELTFQYVQKYVDDVILVSENSIRSAVKLLFETQHFVVEGSAAVGLAALLAEKVKTHGSTILVLTGRNIATNTFCEILAT